MKSALVVFIWFVNVFWCRPQKYDSAAWRGTWELDGGAPMNQASHHVDLLDWMFGPVMDVHAMTATQRMKLRSRIRRL